MNVAIGHTIAHHELEALTGHGSMADVYQARHVDTGQLMAIKIFHPYLVSQPGLMDRFKREAEVMAAMRHPHIASVSEYGTQDGVTYMVMEFLAGGTLEDRLSQGRARGEEIPIEQVLEWMDALCDAVEFAHRSGLIHRDLKPANILFRENGEVVLTDFGLAYLLDRPRLSGTNAITGTPAYLSPEQARGLPGDKRSDVYSLGVILYEILTGQTPFQGTTLSMAMKHISEMPPSPRLMGRYLPPRVEAVVMRTLSKDPVERYQSAQTLARALRGAVETRAATRGTTVAVEARPAGAPSAEKAGPREPLVSAAPSPAARTPAAAPPPPVPSYRAASAPFPVSAGALSLLPGGRLPWYRRWGGALGALVVLGFFAAAVAWGFNGMGTPRAVAATTPRFVAGSAVRVVVPQQASASVLRACPSGFWLGTVGLVTHGEPGVVTARRVCDGKWWYEVSFSALASSAWDGKGWIEEPFLTAR